jgi:predicted molibdopterin-dependent oxidoreductase YjgC
MAEPRDERDLRVDDHDPRGLERGRALEFHFDGQPVRAFEGETIGAALLAAGTRALRITRVVGAPRGMFCGIGACHDCLVTLDGAGPVRACLTPVTEGAEVSTHRLAPPVQRPTR